MFKSISIKNFRCFKDFSIDSLNRVNLIAGKNGVGKTALLEAIFLLIGVGNLGLVGKISHLRGIRETKGDLQFMLELLWTLLFYKLKVDKKINISSELYEGTTHHIELSLKPVTAQKLDLENSGMESDIQIRAGDLSNQVLNLIYTDPSGKDSTFEMKVVNGELVVVPVPTLSPFAAYFLSAQKSLLIEEDTSIFSRLVKSKKTYIKDLLEALKLVEPRLENLAAVQSGGVSIIYGDIGLDQMLPLSLMGDGMIRLVSILLRIADASGGIVLIDEIENGIHHSILDDVWRAIGKAANIFNTQVFATTHSYDCILAAHHAYEKSENYDFRLHRLDRINEKIDVVTYNQETLTNAIKADFEVR
ncbi:MAG: AAA family ATPase [Gammaproteobacteria bacterium]|nr:AAA family ATPase [Gammaproteobacteria bacterium]